MKISDMNPIKYIHDKRFTIMRYLSSILCFIIFVKGIVTLGLDECLLGLILFYATEWLNKEISK